jgi:cytochrome c-type biogenesis protein
MDAGDYIMERKMKSLIISVIFCLLIATVFIAPVLAIITVQQRIAVGILFIILFAIGHCLPIVIAGSFTGFVKAIMENSRWQGAGNWFRRGAGVVIVLLGIYFIVNPFITYL